jgi:hypothetical protein
MITEKLEMNAGVIRGTVRSPSQSPWLFTLNFTIRIAKGSDINMLKKLVKNANQKVLAVTFSMYGKKLGGRGLSVSKNTLTDETSKCTIGYAKKSATKEIATPYNNSISNGILPSLPCSDMAAPEDLCP